MCSCIKNLIKAIYYKMYHQKRTLLINVFYKMRLPHVWAGRRKQGVCDNIRMDFLDHVDLGSDEKITYIKYRM
jgi:hypothetical protein